MPSPIDPSAIVLMAHGAGGRKSAELIRACFLQHFDNSVLREQGDSAILPDLQGPLALTTDSFVVFPLFFPGGDIGKLAICGTINDLAAAGARPRYVTASFILEEGLSLAVLESIVVSMAKTASDAGVPIVAGDTKVVPRGKTDGLYITTTGVGDYRPNERPLRPTSIQPGDAIILSGPIAAHGMAVMACREGIPLHTHILSDCAPLHHLAFAIRTAAPGTRCFRDPTRGGVSAALNELAAASQVDFRVNEAAIPLQPEVAAVCEILGIDPCHVANEGKLVAIVPADESERALASMRAHPLGKQGAQIGRVTGKGNGRVVLETLTGGERILDLPGGDLLPRIC